ncbi:parathyroid hormone 1a [Sphaeramia orbicularis]|uniref:parathyroid hormone 1a n=1 Tax=Sphaeramia orbicularis TaxID=375764 RepID=UPI00117F491A|nr:parathyroid hormone-like [Sphaeramia orbicularis]
MSHDPPKQTDFIPPGQNFYTVRLRRRDRHWVIKDNMRNLDCKIVLLSLCILHISTLSEGRPLRKRAVSEAQLMHNHGEYKQLQERKDWLQMRLQAILPTLDRDSEEKVQPKRRRLHLENLHDLHYLHKLTEEEIKHAITILEKLLESKQS